MRVGILTLSSQDSGGVYQYTITLLESFSKYLKDKYEFIQIKNTSFPKMLDNCIEIKHSKSNFNLKIRRLIHTFTGIKLGDILENYNHPEIENTDLIISPSITLLPYHMKKPYIVTIHDFQQEYYPEFFTLKERISRKIVYKTGQKANVVVCESEYVKKDIIKFLKVPEKKIFVIPSPPPLYIQHKKLEEHKYEEYRLKYDLPNRYLFYPAQFWYHKNHINLIKAIKLLEDKYGETINLILVGSKKNNFDNVMKEIQNLGLQNQVKYLGYVPDEDMPYLYKLSTALVMPTLFESVSIPIWEAFYLGVPVVSSNVCALPEQVGNAGLLFDPYNIEDMAEKIYKIWIDEELRKTLVRKGYERIKDFTLENYAKEWEKIMRGVLYNE
ncbi:glycosyltransferase family 4 protein [Calditerrivibrio nitroreducens]|uniref:Glycosyl transferase group 1 n=1 Tax=Calditerrivibrio nitroreducens (strain DSM 19672 / NBRC 101217 / Yu37-1) TaxID=768670 RepID=E4THC8_CALNY|nr:glycosyltransferase family 1 protein [Calditerrivibrio nitroreducens]ADR19863.1 glycosyl transferase group 1 [Calditerrivibrio nitroreducens DSM 19672]